MNEASLLQMFSNRCPRCREGRIMKSMLEMNDECSACGLPFIQESGQHWGAMVLSYVFGGVIAFPLFLILLLRGKPPMVSVGVPALVLAVVSPFMVRFTRLAWMHIMFFLRPPGGNAE